MPAMKTFSNGPIKRCIRRRKADAIRSVFLMGKNQPTAERAKTNHEPYCLRCYAPKFMVAAGTSNLFDDAVFVCPEPGSRRTNQAFRHGRRSLATFDCLQMDQADQSGSLQTHGSHT